MRLRKDLWLASAAAVASFAASAASAADLIINIDQTTTLHVEEQIATVSVGNPAIADVNVRDGKTLFVLGKSFGRTNIVALDSKGRPVFDTTVLVSQPKSGAVTVYRGAKQTSYDCAGSCQRALVPGDDNDQFDKLQNQISGKVKMGMSGGTN